MKLQDITAFKKKIKINRHLIILSSASIIFLTLLLTAVGLSRSLLNSKLVYNGIYLDNIHLGGLDQTGLKNYLESKCEYDTSLMELSIYHKNYPVKVSFDDLNVHINPETLFKNIYNPGRQGSFIKRLVEIYRLRKNHLYLEMDVMVNNRAVDNLVNEIYGKTYISEIPPSLIIMDNEVSIHSGSYGYKVNKEKLKKRIVEQAGRMESGIVIVPVEEILPSKIDVDSFYSQIIQEPQDAVISIVNGKVEITPEVTGRVLDKAAFLSSVAELEGRSGKYPLDITLPVTFLEPARTTGKIKASLFKDILSSYSTSFPAVTENDMNRAENIRMAVEAISEIILLPGDTFSFNETTGKRTMDKGYRLANIYTSDGIVPGIGGGICQVSSTIYNAVLEANLEVLERNPHLYGVSYVALGRDAAVSYGSEDFRFKNNANWPVMIKGSVTPDNKIRFTIHGTNENPDLKVVILPSVLKTIPYAAEYVEDSTLSGGNSVIKQAGMDGAIVDTFYILRNTKGVVSNYKLHTSTYNPLPEIIHISPGNVP